jgi:heme exporter protein D
MLEALQFSSISEFFQMGGYAFNVWAVYALFVLFFSVNLYFPRIRKKQIIRELKRRLIINEGASKSENNSDEPGNLSDPIGDTSETSQT